MIRNLVVIVFLLVYNIVISQEKRMPIFAFHGVPPGEYSTVSQFSTMKRAGIDICYTLYNSNQEVKTALNAAKKANVKLIIRVSSLFTDTEGTLNLFKNHPALYGYCIGDEPNPSDFDNLAILAKKIKKIDPYHIIYINLFPNYVEPKLLNNITYRDYLNTFVQKVPVSFLSFDNYPIVKDQVRIDWYKNLEDLRSVSLNKDIDFWAFACSTIHYDYRQPTVSGIKLQQFGNLLYGAQGLQYFAYWTLNYEANWRKENYGYSIVDDRGNPTPTYNVVKSVNEQIQRLAWVFSGAKSVAVFHTGINIPEGTKKLYSVPEQFKFFTTYGKEAIVSIMSNGKNKFIIVQNKSLSENMRLEYQPKMRIRKVDNNTGKSMELSLLKKYNDSILPGDIIVFAYN